MEFSFPCYVGLAFGWIWIGFGLDHTIKLLTVNEYCATTIHVRWNNTQGILIYETNPFIIKVLNFLNFNIHSLLSDNDDDDETNKE